MQWEEAGWTMTVYVVMLVVVLLIGIAVLGILYSILSRRDRARPRR